MQAIKIIKIHNFTKKWNALETTGSHKSKKTLLKK
jgi:hypothetical protein